MSDVFIDSTIFILLVMAVGFGGIGVIGLLLFPDIRSRMFTAFRATVISFSTLTLAVIIYALFTFLSDGGNQYITLVLHSIILICTVFVANIVLYRIIIVRTRNTTLCQKVSVQNNNE
jgi:multisubunit Na+/H+ antiporter MnhG subunit